jgi:serine/threonine-protein kinase
MATRERILLKITREDPVSMAHWRPDVPAGIDAILRWAMAKDVDGRFVNVHAFAHALTPFAPGEGQILIQRIGEIASAGKRRRAEVAVAGSRVVDQDPPVVATAPPANEDLKTILLAPPPLASPPLASPPLAPFLKPSSSSIGTEPPSAWRTPSVALGASTVALLSVLMVLMVLRSGPGRAALGPSEPVVAPPVLRTASVPPLPAAAQLTEAPTPAAGPSAVVSAPSIKTAALTSPPGVLKVPSKPTLAETPAPAPSKVEMGTILATAIGGSCAFSVDGASQGTSSKLILPIKAGSHTVVCRTAMGAAKSWSASVNAGETVLHIFKL